MHPTKDLGWSPAPVRLGLLLLFSLGSFAISGAAAPAPLAAEGDGLMAIEETTAQIMIRQAATGDLPFHHPIKPFLTTDSQTPPPFGGQGQKGEAPPKPKGGTDESFS